MLFLVPRQPTFARCGRVAQTRRSGTPRRVDLCGLDSWQNEHRAGNRGEFATASAASPASALVRPRAGDQGHPAGADREGGMGPCRSDSLVRPPGTSLI